MKTNFNRMIWIVVAFIAVMAALSIVWIFLYRGTPPTTYTGQYGPMGYFPAYGAFIFMPIMAVLSILVVFLILRFVFGFFGHAGHVFLYDSQAVEILKQRYARGEISEEEYRKKLSEIQN